MLEMTDRDDPTKPGSIFTEAAEKAQKQVCNIFSAVAAYTDLQPQSGGKD